MMFQEVVSFLLEFKAIDLLSGVISKSRAPRATVSVAFRCLHCLQSVNDYALTLSRDMCCK